MGGRSESSRVAGMDQRGARPSIVELTIPASALQLSKARGMSCPDPLGRFAAIVRATLVHPPLSSLCRAGAGDDLHPIHVVAGCTTPATHAPTHKASSPARCLHTSPADSPLLGDFQTGFIHCCVSYPMAYAPHIFLSTPQFPMSFTPCPILPCFRHIPLAFTPLARRHRCNPPIGAGMIHPQQIELAARALPWTTITDTCSDPSMQSRAPTPASCTLLGCCDTSPPGRICLHGWSRLDNSDASRTGLRSRRPGSAGQDDRSLWGG
jgi:hypothetical protein